MSGRTARQLSLPTKRMNNPDNTSHRKLTTVLSEFQHSFVKNSSVPEEGGITFYMLQFSSRNPDVSALTGYFHTKKM